MISLAAIAASALLLQIAIGALAAWAGPPFFTDDPETVGHRHWEIDVALQTAKDKGGTSGTAPHFEMNYGLSADLDLHALVPLPYSNPNTGPTRYGLGDIELGTKVRFVQESDKLPMVGTSPLLQIPTGDDRKGLGSGHVRAFLPLWLLKTRKEWTAFGGGGYWINPGPENKNYWFIGAVVQRDLSGKITLGAELFHTTPQAKDQGGHTGFNLGGFFHFTDEHHLLFSAGRDLHGSNRFSMYVGYQLLLGPKEKKEGVLSFVRGRR